MSVNWELNVIEGKNPIHTGGFLASFDSRGFTPEEVVARESGQNALDAGKNSMGATELVFQKLRVCGRNKAKFLELFEFTELLKPRIDVFFDQPRNQNFSTSVRKFLDDDELSALLIRDFNTCGLGGKWNRYEKEDHFARLVCALNLDDKADGDSASGGSFGLGKTAYANSSKINTVVYHSTFQANEDTNGISRRLMAAGVYPRHKYDGKNFGGFAYFGESDPENLGAVKPFEDKVAANFWETIGKLFNTNIERTEQQHGTDILILMNSLDLTEVKRAVEDYYFPAILSGDIVVKFINEDREPEYPKVLERKDLKQFIDLLKKAQSKSDFETETLLVKNLNRMDNYKIGRIAFEADKFDVAYSNRSNCVAITRGTGMIANYIKIGSDQYESAVGIFVADEDVWEFLLASENAAHSEWNEHSRRLNQDYPENGKKIVGRLNRTVTTRFREFQKSLQPEVSSTRNEGGLLARLLSVALSGSIGDEPVPPGRPNPVSVNLTKKERKEALSVWKLQIRENEHTPDEPFTLVLYPSISLAGDTKLVEIKHMDLKVKNENGSLLEQGTKPELTLMFCKDRVLNFNIEFENPGRLNYLVKSKFIAVMEFVND